MRCTNKYFTYQGSASSPSITLFFSSCLELIQNAWSSSSLLVTMKTKAVCEGWQNRNMEWFKSSVIALNCHTMAWEWQKPDFLQHEKRKMKGGKSSLIKVTADPAVTRSGCLVIRPGPSLSFTQMPCLSGRSFWASPTPDGRLVHGCRELHK